MSQHKSKYSAYWKSAILLWISRWLSGKESACNAGDTGEAGWMPESGGSPGGGNGNQLQYSCLENPTDRGALAGFSVGVAESDMTEHACSVNHDFFF